MILILCTVVILSLVAVYKLLEVQRLEKRCKHLRRERITWAKRALESEQKLKVTQDICNVTMRNCLEYKRELTLSKLSTESKEGVAS